MVNNRQQFYSKYKDRHHIVPISLKGYDTECNIAEILRTDHELIHQTLDMNSRLFYNLSRLAKEKTNHKLIMSPDDLQYWFDVQNVYFERLNRLPTNIKQIHLEKMLECVKYEHDRLQKLTTSKLEINKTFDTALIQYHNLWKELASAIQTIFKNWIKVK